MVDRLIDVSTSRLAPPEVMAEFRGIDPRTELLYIGKGKWWLGMVYDNIPLIQMGRQALIEIKAEGGAPWSRLRLCQLKAQGFRKVHLHDIGPDGEWRRLERWPRDPMWGLMINRFRMQDWIFRHFPNSDASWQRLMLRHELGGEGSEIAQVAERALDLVQSERKSLWRRVKKSPWVGWKRAANE